MFDNLSLKAKILLGSSTTLCLLVALCTVSLVSVDTLEETNEWVSHTHKVVQAAMEVEAAAVDMETGMRGFLIAGKEEFLAPYKGGKKRFGEQIDRLKDTVSDNPAQVRLLSDIETTIEEWEANVTEGAITLRRDIGDGQTMNDMAKQVGEAKGKRYFDKFRGQIATFIERERALLNKREKATQGSMNVEVLRKNAKWVTHTHSAIAEALAIEGAAVDMETGMRGYLLSGKDEFLQPYKEGQRRFSQKIRAMKVKVSDNPTQVALLDDIESNIEAWQSNVTEPTIALRREIGDSKTMDDMAALVGEARGKQYFDKFRSQVKTFRDRELQLMTDRQASAKSAVRGMNYTITIGLVLAIVLSIGVAFLVSNSITQPFQAIFKGLKKFSANELKELNAGFAAVVSNLGSSAGRVGTASGEIAQASRHLSRLSARQATSVEETSSSVQEISSMVQNNVKLAMASESMSSEAGKRMVQLTGAMGEIDESNKKIRDLVKIITEIGTKTEVIGEIVFQTKLLSFNASVEAERAGDHGRGFAVVAQEVGNLAELSGKANVEISRIVRESISEAESIANENGKRVEAGFRIVEKTREQAENVAQSSAQISEASNQQAIGVEEISGAIETINQGTQHAASISEQASESSVALRHETQELTRAVRSLNGFLRGHEEAGPTNTWDSGNSTPLRDELTGDLSGALRTTADNANDGVGESNEDEEWERLAG